MIRLEGATYHVGSFTLGPLDLHVARGEALVVLGPSGAGKSTLLDVIAGFRPLDSGRLWLAGEDAAGLRPEARSCAWVSQGDTLFPHLSVADNIAYGLARAGVAVDERAAKVAAIAERTGISALTTRAPSSLSGGERQRVAFARALVIEPRVLLCDEPFSALDPGRRRALRTLLAELQREQGFTLVHVTHDLAEADGLGSRAAVLLDGKLTRTGDVGDVLRDPGPAEVREAFGLPPS